MPVQVGMELQDVAAPTKSRTKPKLAIRRRRRTTVTKLYHYLALALKQDQAEVERSVVQGYEPYLFLRALTGPNKAALDRLMERCKEVLTKRI